MNKYILYWCNLEIRMNHCALTTSQINHKYNVDKRKPDTEEHISCYSIHVNYRNRQKLIDGDRSKNILSLR